MNALRIYTTVSKTPNVSMRMFHFVMIVIPRGIVKTATAAKVISISISISTLIITCSPSYLRNSKIRTIIYLLIYSFIYLSIYLFISLFISLCRVFRGWMPWWPLMMYFTLGNKNIVTS